MKNIFKFLTIAFLATALFSCNEDIMNVPNENNPDFTNVYASGDDVEKVASGLFNTVFEGELQYVGVYNMLGVMSDNSTCSWGNFGMRDVSWEPRDYAWDNTPTYANNTQTKWSFDMWYSAIVTASNVIKAIDEGTEIGPNGANNDRTRAFAKFAQGLAYADLALIFDRAFLVDENRTVEATLEAAVPYQEIAAAALEYLEEASNLANSSFTIPSSWVGTADDLSSAQFKQLINTNIAKLLAYLPRNNADLRQVDWNKVKQYADNGITSDFTIIADDANWYFYGLYYLNAPGWGRTDMYVVNLMDPELTQHWPDDPTFHERESTNPIDQRIFTDFEYLSFNDFQPARGYYHFTNYRWKRYDNYIATFTTPVAYHYKAENDMFRAQARAYLGDLQGAADIINAGTRITRGQMEPVSADFDEIIKAIHHERHVEMYSTAMGVPFFEMRTRDLLQKGTPLHFPLPAQTLQTMGLTEFYTFGTTARADGINTSNGGWR